MRTHTIFAAFAVLTFAAGSAGAQGKGHDKDHDKDQDHGKATKHLSREDAEAIRLRDLEYARIHNSGSRVPPGLAKKPGQMPPGQYKKRYGTSEGASVLRDNFRRRGYTVTRVAPYGQSQYVYYRLRDGAEQRALVSNGTNQLQFTNVPSSILQAVLAQLY
jgi:hypothetical protein